MACRSYKIEGIPKRYLVSLKKEARTVGFTEHQTETKNLYEVI